MAIARSLRCQVPNVPEAPDPPSLNAKAKNGSQGGDGDSLYNQCLDKEYYRNSKSGGNYWLSPRHDYFGPDGPGYYAQQDMAYLAEQRSQPRVLTDPA